MHIAYCIFIIFDLANLPNLAFSLELLMFLLINKPENVMTNLLQSVTWQISTAPWIKILQFVPSAQSLQLGLLLVYKILRNNATTEWCENWSLHWDLRLTKLLHFGRRASAEPQEHLQRVGGEAAGVRPPARHHDISSLAGLSKVISGGCCED